MKANINSETADCVCLHRSRVEDWGHLAQARRSFGEPREESLVKLMFGVMTQMLSQETSEGDVNTALLPTLHVGER